jgi:carbonic anhydrase
MCGLCDFAALRLSRRGLIGGGLALAAAGVAPSRAAEAPPPGAANAIHPAAALQLLIDGNRRYAANKPVNLDYSHNRAERAASQYPIAAVLSCADSRVAPELIFDQGPGQVFVVRIAGNFVSLDGLASLEYAVHFLGAPLVFVLGHSGCGAIAAAIKVLQEGVSLPGQLPHLIRDLKPAVRAAIDRKPKDLLAQATRENVRMNVAELNADQPILAGAVARGTVMVAGGIYDIATGLVTLL